MADRLPTSNAYQLLGGVDVKNSDYDYNKAAFQNLRNLDFFVPNALSKRPGSTQAVAVGTSGAINSLFEFQKLAGASYIVAGSDTAMFYLAASAYTLLSAGWTNGQPTDMLTFQDRLWMCNGQKFERWDGTTLISVGGGSVSGVTMPSRLSNSGQATMMTVAGYTVTGLNPGAQQVGRSFIIAGMWVALSGVRSDGFYGPLELSSARQIIQGNGYTSGTEWFNSNAGYADGLERTASVAGYTAYAVWVGIDRFIAEDRWNGGSYYIDPSGTPLGVSPWTLNGIGYDYFSQSYGGGWLSNFTDQIMSTASPSKFYLYTLFPASQVTFTVSIQNWNLFVQSSHSFSGLPFNFYGTFTPKYIDQNNNVMFMAGFSNAPSTIQFSEVGQPEYTQSDYNFEVRTNDGDVITGTKTYNNIVVVTKERSFSKIVGSTPDDIEIVELSTEYGCLSNKSMVEYRQKLCWLDRQGILEFNGSTWQIISTPVEPIFRRMNLAAAKEKAVAVNHIYRNQVWFGIPIDGSSTNNLTVVYDYLVGAWTFFDGFSPASFALAKGTLSQPTAYYGGYSGKVHYFGESFFGDNGSGITCLGLPNWDMDRGQNSTSVWRRFFLDVATNSSGVTGKITTKIFADYDASTVRATFAMYQNAFQSRAEFGVPAKAVTCEFSHYSASLPLQVNGFSWTKRYLRNV